MHEYCCPNSEGVAGEMKAVLGQLIDIDIVRFGSHHLQHALDGTVTKEGRPLAVLERHIHQQRLIPLKAKLPCLLFDAQHRQGDVEARVLGVAGKRKGDVVVAIFLPPHSRRGGSNFGNWPTPIFLIDGNWETIVVADSEVVPDTILVALVTVVVGVMQRVRCNVFWRVIYGPLAFTISHV
jgi:hypothetical protein